MLRYTNVAVVIIDQPYRILTINAAARRLLGVREFGLRSGLPCTRARHALPGSTPGHRYVPFANISTVTLAGNRAGPDIRRLRKIREFHCHDRCRLEHGAPELAVITAIDVTDQVQIKKRLEAVQREHMPLVGELSAANKRFGNEQRAPGRQRRVAGS